MKFDTSKAWNQMFSGGLGFLLTQARSGFLADMERELAPLNITSAQFMVVVGIAHERASTLTEFCDFMGYDSGAMKRLLDRVEEKGVIRRVRSLEDRRSQILELTEEGVALYPQIMEAVRKVHARSLEGFTPEEATQLQGFLQRIIASNRR
ncbi:MarR family winged helix-turn-helix transcriptional regulator [Pseudoduganella aquatica]|jgi:DNA-binding MarR family transcriptional regulator|uniref:MarR family transcriptional regulator n=1 Tax=Pseudoduganella aquatica TaxID=2660641 RepID=A0A7X4KMW2_9BURK|nr:MarR family transcriptional regulator [Pseudoduganella aquatica]MYN08577.1 MarR family transcriptional regulator [Pseudoduganella aquatica]